MVIRSGHRNPGRGLDQQVVVFLNTQR